MPSVLVWLMLSIAVAPALASTGPVVRTPARCDRLYVFGDSYSDTGYGYVDGDGPTAIAYAAQALGITLLPADVAGMANSRNFAVSGAPTGRNAGQTIGRAMLGLGMIDQVDRFIALVRNKGATFAPSDTVFFLAGGLNDAALPLAQTQRNIRAQVRLLYAAGGRRFVIASIPTTLVNRDVGLRLNPTLPGLIRSLAHEFPAAAFAQSEWGTFFDRVHADARSYGFNNARDACAGRAIFRQDATPCLAPALHFFYHADHPSTAAHRMVGSILADEARTIWCRS